tara:strand:- start:8107 stop:8424 length:318 start_codon:yes stop_codon:yes gene_type:complete
MVLYYDAPISQDEDKQIIQNKIISNTPPVQNAIPAIPSVRSDTFSLFGRTPELNSNLLEESFVNLDTDEKLIFLYKNSVIQHKSTKRYITGILFLLFLIIIKLYS